MNYFIITDSENAIESIKNIYQPIKYFFLPDLDLGNSDMFIYDIDIMTALYDGNSVVVYTSIHKNIRNLFATVNYSEIENLCTLFITDEKNTDYLRATKIDNIIVREADET